MINLSILYTYIITTSLYAYNRIINYYRVKKPNTESIDTITIDFYQFSYCSFSLEVLNKTIELRDIMTNR